VIFSDLNEELQGKDDDDNIAGAELMVMERPRSWGHLVKTLFSADEYKLLRLQNADGYFYLLYLKYCAVLFSICKSVFQTL